MKHSILLFVICISASLGGGCSGSSEGGSQTNSQNSSSTSVQNAGQPNVGASNLPRSGRPVMRYVPAPEDSQIAQATQDGKLYEVRIWKKHPKLLKIESTTIDEKNKSMSIILRTAQVVNITTDRIPNVGLATADQFLALVPETATTAAKTDSRKAE